MNRVMVYPGAIPLETDLLNAQKNDMIGLAKLAAAVLGTTTQVSGLACTPNSPAALNVIVAPGEIYSLQNIDGTAYSSLAADTAHQIVKQGIMLDQVILSTPAPATAGQSINYLIQATYSDVDGTAVVLPYYNASNPATAFSGPANAGTTNNTVRAGVCTVSAKAGVSATTGSQTTPAPDAGNVGLYVVTVANGQTTVTAPNIVTAANAPFISPLSGYAALAGLATQIFRAANAVGTNDVVPLGQGDGRYAKLAGLLSQVFRVANGVAVNDAVALGQFAFTNGANGVFKIPMVGGNLIFQWGQTGSIAVAAAISVTFPIAFPNFCFFVNYIGDANNAAGNANETVVGKNTFGFSSINYNAATANFNWVAIGW